jgi:Fe-S oxidoreductase
VNPDDIGITIHLKEMDHNRESAICCGLPATGWYPEIGSLITEQTLTDARNTGAGTLATTCGFCKGGFSMWNERHGAKLHFQIEDFMSIVAEATGVLSASESTP